MLCTTNCENQPCHPLFCYVNGISHHPCLIIENPVAPIFDNGSSKRPFDISVKNGLVQLKGVTFPHRKLHVQSVQPVQCVPVQPVDYAVFTCIFCTEVRLKNSVCVRALCVCVCDWERASTYKIISLTNACVLSIVPKSTQCYRDVNLILCVLAFSQEKVIVETVFCFYQANILLVSMQNQSNQTCFLFYSPSLSHTHTTHTHHTHTVCDTLMTIRTPEMIRTHRQWT